MVDDLFCPNFLPNTQHIATEVRSTGFSWLITDQELSIVPISGPLPKKAKGDVRGAEKNVPLIFSFPTRQGGRKMVTVPLANTLFQTQKIATMTRFTVDEGCLQGPNATDEEQKIYKITLPRCPDLATIDYMSHLPLLRLTPPRKVLACAGNILRTIAPSAPSEEPTSTAKTTTTAEELVGVPASKELELAVDRYLTNLHRSGKIEKLKVFAAITKSATPSVPNPWDLASGDKLRQVLSGGGGWGAKEGLLSLDPQEWTYAEISKNADAKFRESFEKRFFGSNDDIKDVRGLPAKLGKPENSSKEDSNGVVQIGDYVSFFAADHPGSAIRRRKPQEEAERESHETAQLADAFHFGCVHKEGDIHSTAWRDAQRRQLATKILSLDVMGVFGARSEEGVWVQDEKGESGGKKLNEAGGKNKKSASGFVSLIFCR